MVSCWHYNIHGTLYKGDNFENFIKHYAWDKKGNPLNKHWLEQHYHIQPMSGGDCQWVDFIGRFESLQEDWLRVCKKIGISEELPHMNKNECNRKHYVEYYNRYTKQIVADKFKKDMELFGCEFGK